jgi:hypothetical protein
MPIIMGQNYLHFRLFKAENLEKGILDGVVFFQTLKFSLFSKRLFVIADGPVATAPLLVGGLL